MQEGKGKTSSTTPTIMHRRGRCPHRPALPRSLSPVGRGDHTLPPGIAPQLMKKPCHYESAPRPWQSASPSAAVFMSPTAPFLSAAKEREERTPPKPRFWNPFRGWGVVHVGLLLPRGPGCAKFAPCFRMVSARHPLAAHAGPRCPDAAGKHFASAVLCATFLVIVS